MILAISDLPPAPPGRKGWPWTEAGPALPATLSDGRTWPKVSITTPSFRQGKYIEETIRSVLLQGYPDLEYFVMDGGSQDETVEIIKKYEPWLSGWVSEKDRGQADAINKGFARSAGEYVGWLNSDDYYYPGFLGKMTAAISERPEVGLIYGDVETAWDDGDRKANRRGRATTYEEMLRTLKIPIPQQSCLWRRSVVGKIGPLDTRWPVCIDREYFMRTCRHTRFEYIPGAVAMFRFHTGTFATSHQRKWLVEMPALYREIYERPDFPPELRRHKRETMCSVWLYCARMAMRINEPLRSASYVLRAVATWPPILFRQNDIYPAIGKRLRRLLPGSSGRVA